MKNGLANFRLGPWLSAEQALPLAMRWLCRLMHWLCNLGESTEAATGSSLNKSDGRTVKEVGLRTYVSKFKAKLNWFCTAAILQLSRKSLPRYRLFFSAADRLEQRSSSLLERAQGLRDGSHLTRSR